MKVAIVTYFFPKISETFILNRITRLLDAGIDVGIFSIYDPAIVKASEDIVQETIVHPDVIRYSLRNHTTYLPKNGDGKLNYGAITDLFENSGCDLIHFQWGNLAEDLLSNIKIKRPIFTSFQSYNTPRSWRVAYNTFDNTFKLADLILPASNYIKTGLKKMGCPLTKILVHHMGVDTNLFILNPNKPSLSDGRIRILSVGNFIEKKGFQDAIEAVARLPRFGINNFEYRLAGDGGLRPNFERKVSRLGLIDKVVFLGKLTQDQVIDEYKTADLMIHPSILSSGGDDEGIPTVIMEAQSAELPVVSTFHTGIPEIIKDDYNGLLVPEHDINGLSEKLKILIENPEKRLKMGALGRGVVLKDYNVDILSSEMIQLYEEFSRNN